MSKRIFYRRNEFELGDRVSFLNDGDRLVGKVVRVYSDRLNYHVEVNGQRFEVYLPDDDMKEASDDD